MFAIALHPRFDYEGRDEPTTGGRRAMRRWELEWEAFDRRERRWKGKRFNYAIASFEVNYIRIWHKFTWSLDRLADGSCPPLLRHIQRDRQVGESRASLLALISLILRLLRSLLRGTRSVARRGAEDGDDPPWPHLSPGGDSAMFIPLQ